MSFSYQHLFVGLLSAGLALAGFGCLGGDPGADQEGAAFRPGIHHVRVLPPRPGSGGTTGASSGTGGAMAAGTGGTGGATPTDGQAVIRAAQTPDGAAVPQPAGPNGQCPEVVVLLGFWSCPQIGQTCSYTSSSGKHDCFCDRQDGEGGLPDWVCDQ